MTEKMKYSALMVGIMAVVLVGCSSNPPAEQADNSTPATAPNGTAAPGRKAEGSRARSAATKEEAPATVTVPAGTVLSVRLVNAISSGTASAGSSFDGTLASPLMAGGVEVAAVGSAVSGTVTNAVSSGRLSKPAELALTLNSLTPRGGANVAISTSSWSASGASHKKRDIEMIGGGAAAGALVGALTGGKKGAAIGTLVGGGGGTAVAAGTGKKEITLASETKLNFTLTQAITLPAH
ncbi:MAG TPA: hypothetical protein VG028_03715 [Terriglobia bacterium]|nr:hypothetical protein [Terriglobia bacterium]